MHIYLLLVAIAKCLKPDCLAISITLITMPWLASLSAVMVISSIFSNLCNLAKLTFILSLLVSTSSRKMILPLVIEIV